MVAGPSVGTGRRADPEVDADLRGALDRSLVALGSIKAAAEAGTGYDQMLATGNAARGLVMGAIDALVAQTWSIERAVSALSLEAIAFEGSDSLDNPEAVFQ